MILRRVVEHMKAQHWTAVAIELVIVVLGVFIGIRASNWNQARVDARLGQSYVRRLIHDLGQDRVAITARVDYYTAILHSIQVTDELLRTADADPRALVINAYRASEVDYTPPVRSTWDEIVSSGHAGMLPPVTVQLGLPQYYAFDLGRDVYEQGLASPYRRTVRSIIPITMEAAIREGCSDERNSYGVLTGFAKTCRFRSSPAALAQVASELRANPAVAADLRFQYGIVRSALNDLAGLKSNIDDELRALADADA